MEDLRETAREAVGNYFESLMPREQICAGCVDFRWRHGGSTDIMDIENRPYAICNELDIIRRGVGYPNDVYRLYECLLNNLKEDK